MSRESVVIVWEGKLRPDGSGLSELRIGKRFEEKTVAAGSYEACLAARRLLWSESDDGPHTPV